MHNEVPACQAIVNGFSGNPRAALHHEDRLNGFLPQFMANSQCSERRSSVRFVPRTAQVSGLALRSPAKSRCPPADPCWAVPSAKTASNDSQWPFDSPARSVRADRIRPITDRPLPTLDHQRGKRRINIGQMESFSLTVRANENCTGGGVSVMSNSALPLASVALFLRREQCQTASAISRNHRC